MFWVGGFWMGGFGWRVVSVDLGWFWVCLDLDGWFLFFGFGWLGLCFVV